MRPWRSSSSCSTGKRRRGSSPSWGPCGFSGQPGTSSRRRSLPEEDSSRTTVQDLGLGDDPRLVALGEQIQAEENARWHVDHGWIAGFVATLFAIHLARMGLDRTFLGILSPAVAVFGDLWIGLVAAFGIIIPLRLVWRKSTRGLERVVWRWSITEPAGSRGRWLRLVLERWLSYRLRFSIQLRRASYSLPEALSRGLQIGLPVAAVMAAVYPVLGMSWYFDTENWAAGAWDSWAESRTDIWREAMVKAVVGKGPPGRGVRVRREAGRCPIRRLRLPRHWRYGRRRRVTARAA